MKRTLSLSVVCMLAITSIAMAERFRSSVGGAFHPLTDGSFADAKGLGNLALGPALVFELLGLEPSGFSPVAGCIVHAWDLSTDTSRALDFYTRASNKPPAMPGVI